ncbi:MAG TPA: RICIN domain-containing protein [Bryobacteraceae bacterium]|nr:RICIN domain-containing protein [Bryobacteraceae bacterium]
MIVSLMRCPALRYFLYCICLSATCSPAHAQSLGTDGAYYYIVSQLSGKVIDLPSQHYTQNGTQLQEYGANQQWQQFWQFVLLSDGSFRIVNKLSGMAMEVPAQQLGSNGVVVQQWDVNELYGGAQQMWQVVAVDSNGDYELINEGSGKCLDLTGGYTQDTTPIQQWDCNGGTQQHWQLQKVSGVVSGVGYGAGAVFEMSRSTSRDFLTRRTWP